MNISHADPDFDVFEDPRVEWIKTRVIRGLDITCDEFLRAPKTDCNILRLFLLDNAEAGTILHIHCNYDELEIQEEDKGMEATASAEAHVEYTTGETRALEQDDEANNDGLLDSVIISPKLWAPNLPVEEANEKETCHLSANTAEIKNGHSKFTKKCPRCRFSLAYPIIEGTPYRASIAYFIKQTEGSITLRSINKALDLMMHEVYDPLVDVQLSHSKNISDMLHSEFQNSMAKYQTQLKHTIHQVQAEILLALPSHIRFDDPELRYDLEAISCLRATVKKWEKVLEDVILTETSKEMKCCAGPLGVIEYWRRQCVNVGNLYEQLSMPKVQMVIQLLDSFEPESTAAFHFQSNKLGNIYAVAKNNVKFLSTLERYFKILVHGSISTLLDSLPPMMNAIRMVWTLSRHFNTKESMLYLLKLIARQLEEKVRVMIDPFSIFHSTGSDAAEKRIQLAQELLKCWYNTYLDVRQQIQNSSLDNLWEFDEKQLFEQTGYMSEVCGELGEIVTAISQLLKFVGPKLCDITGHSTDIDTIKESVHNNLIFPLQKVPFDIFCQVNKQNWKTMTKKLKESVVDTEDMIKKIIEEYSKKLQSSMGAFDLVCTFQTIEGRGSIHRHLKECYKGILQQYMKELNCLSGMFKKRKECPPIRRSFPPTHGAISWANDLYLRAKRPMVRFKVHNDILLNPFGEEVKKLYLDFAKEVDLYKIGLHEEWKRHVRVVGVSKLRYPVLCLRTTTQSDDQVGSAADEAQSIAAPESNFSYPSAPCSGSKNINLNFNPQWSFSVNFSPELLMIIREAKYLSRLGLDIPETAISVTLQEEKYHKHIHDLNLMLAAYQKTKEQLSPIDCTILKPRFSILWKTLSDGVYTLNWNSQRINAYVNACKRAVAKFQSIVNQVHKNKSMIQEVEATISNEKLIRKSDFLGPTGNPLPPMSVTEFYDKIEMNRVARLDVLSSKYCNLGRYFNQIEMVIARTSTGFNSAFTAYYYHWEKRFSNAITRMLLISMASFYTLCGGRGGEWTPLCELKIIRRGKDLIVNPTINDIYKYFARIVRNIVESSKKFPRWMHGSCKPALPMKMLEEDEPYVFSFYEDLAQNVDIVQLMLTTSQVIHHAFSKINRYLDGWQRYDRVYDLWNIRKKNALLEKDKTEAYTCVYLDSRMACYSLLSETVRSQQSTVVVDFLIADCRGVARSTADQADTRKKAYGEVLYRNSSLLLRRLVSKMKSFQNNLEMAPTDLPTLEVVLSTIADIVDARIEMELDYFDIMERYATLIQWDIPVPEEELSESAKLAEKWQRLCIQSKTKNTQLSSVSDKFRGVTEQMSVEFTADVKKLCSDLLFSGPGAVSLKSGLDEGLTMMSEYNKKLSDLMTRKMELVNTEELLGLPACDCSRLVDSSLYFERLKHVYHLYESQISFERSFKSMSWLDLDVESLQKGVLKLEEIEAHAGEGALDIPAFRAIQQCMHDFKNSIPLIILLKNDALRPRHWNRLLSAAKVSSPSVCTSQLSLMTLRDVFALQLHRFPLLVSKVIDEASQELKIDTELNSIELFWKKTDLGLK